MNEYLTKHLHNLRLFIGKWQGGHVQLWSYTASHSEFVIRIEEKGRRGNLHIVCAAVQFIHGPTGWENCSFEVIHSPTEDDAYEFILRDQAADFEVRAGVLEVKENCKPIY